MSVISKFRKSLIALDESKRCRKGKDHAWQPTDLTLVAFATGDLSTRPGFQCVYCRFGFIVPDEEEAEAEQATEDER